METIIANAKTAGIDIGAVAGGMIVANVAVKAIKKDTLVVNGAIALGGLAGATMVKHNGLKMLLVGASVFGVMRCLTIAVAGATEPGVTAGIAGIIPEGLKDKIRGFLPQLNGVEDEDLNGDVIELMGDVNLDDVEPVTVDGNYEDVTESTQGVMGLGDLERLLV